MHIEKNVYDNLLRTLLNLDGKTKNNMKVRMNLQELDIRYELHPKMLANDRIYLPPASYTMYIQEKYNFLIVLRNIKVPMDLHLTFQGACILKNKNFLISKVMMVTY